MDSSIVHLLAKGDGWDRYKIGLEKHGGVLYGVNDAFIRSPEVDVTFHMHDLQKFLEDPRTNSSTKLCIEYAKDKPSMEFYTTKYFPQIPHSKEYPLEEVLKRFKMCYFSSTVEYIIAYSLMNGCKELFLYGVNMMVKQEYIDEKPGVEFWLGIAIGMGVKVHFQHDVTSLLKTKNGLLYGYLIDQWIES